MRVVPPIMCIGIIHAVLTAGLLAPLLAGSVADQRSPVVFEGEKSGEWTALNVSGESLLAICGRFMVRDHESGQMMDVAFSRLFVGVFFEEEKALPVGGVYRFEPLRYRGREVRRENIELTGAVLGDGTLWGVDGAYLLQKIRSQASETLLQLVEIRRKLAMGSFEENEKLITSLRPIVRGRDCTLVHLVLRRRLMTDTVPREARKDYMEQLSDLISRLEERTGWN